MYDDVVWALLAPMHAACDPVSLRISLSLCLLLLLLLVLVLVLLALVLLLLLLHRGQVELEKAGGVVVDGHFQVRVCVNRGRSCVTLLWVGGGWGG